MLNIYRGREDSFGLSFYPDAESEFYYVDPVNRDNYIALEDYFNYLKTVRTTELQKIAQDLGAKHFRVTCVHTKKARAVKKGAAKAKVKGVAGADAKHDVVTNAAATHEIIAESKFPGHEPVEPKLEYLARDPAIKALIALRMDEKGPLEKQKYTLRCSDSSGIKASDAVKIDAVIKSMKCHVDVSVTSEAESESKKYFEYEVDF